VSHAASCTLRPVARKTERRDGMKGKVTVALAILPGFRGTG
jgi:hypothetical protein